LKPGFKAEKTQVEYLKNGKIKTREIDDRHPTLEYVDPFSIYFDPSVRRFEDARWVAHRKIMPLNVAVNKYKALGAKISDENVAAIRNTPQYFSTYDYSRVKNINYFESRYYGTN
jgi:hypothetical protein